MTVLSLNSCKGCNSVALLHTGTHAYAYPHTHTHTLTKTYHLLTWPDHVPLGVTDLGKRTNLSSSLSCLTPLSCCPALLHPVAPGVEGQDKQWQLLFIPILCLCTSPDQRFCFQVICTYFRNALRLNLPRSFT